MSLTPNTRKRKNAFAARLTNTMKDFSLHNEDFVDVVTLSVKQMGILDSIKENWNRVSAKLGRKKISYNLRKKVWNYWHNNATTSTLTSRPAKLRVSDHNKIQTDLEFASSVTTVLQRRWEYFESCWMTIELPYKNLHKFVQSYDCFHMELLYFF